MNHPQRPVPTPRDIQERLDRGPRPTQRPLTPSQTRANTPQLALDGLGRAIAEGDTVSVISTSGPHLAVVERLHLGATQRAVVRRPDGDKAVVSIASLVALRSRPAPHIKGAA